MVSASLRAPARVRLALACSLVLLTGCLRGDPDDPTDAVSLTPPAGWSAVAPAGPVVPGRCVSAWKGPGGSSLALVQTLAVPRGDAEGLVRELTTRLENLPGMRIVKAETRTKAEVKIAWVEAVAPGTGDALAPTGLGKATLPGGESPIATHRVQIGLPLRPATFWIVIHYPEADVAARSADVDSILKGLMFRDRLVVSPPK